MRAQRLYRLFIVVLCMVAISSFLMMYLLERNNNYYSLQLYSQQSDLIQTSDYNEQSFSPTLESPFQAVPTITPEIKYNKIDKSRLPWYFKNGVVRPTKSQNVSDSKVKTRRVWPYENENADRVEEQLMFVPLNYQYENAPLKSILIYTGLYSWDVREGQHEFLRKECPVNRCSITSEIKKSKDVDAILFRHQFSIPNHTKKKSQVWIFYILESPSNLVPIMRKNDVFNWTASYRLDSDIVTPYERWTYYNPAITQVDILDRNYAFNKTKKVAWFVSNCWTANKRLQYAQELSKYISVDIYGRCGKLTCKVSENCFKMLDEDYKFYLAFENSNCIDYISEKLFLNALGNNVLPIVMGGRKEDYERVAPKQSYIHVEDFNSPKELAEYLYRLDNDDDLYNEYFRWKGTGEFIDTRFFCRLCAMLHDDNAPDKHYQNIEDWWNGPGICKTNITEKRFIDSSNKKNDLNGSK